MARTIQQWFTAILAEKSAQPALDELDSTSAVAEWRLWAWLVAVCANALDKLFDFFKTDVLNILATKRPHTPQWYVQKAKAFQFGIDLPDDSDVYAVVPPTDETVLAITEAAAVEMPNGRVRLKVATGSPLAPVPAAKFAAFKAYMARVKDAGVKLDITTGVADDMNLGLTIYYNPLVLDEDGKRLDGTSDTPVKDAVVAFLEKLKFNGLFVTAKLVDALQAIEGVEIPEIDTIESRYAAMPFVALVLERTPDSGYFRIVDAYFDANITYVPHDPII